MTIYIDILLITNLFINFLILQITGGIISCRTSFCRIFLGSAAGALTSLTIFLPETGLALSLAIKLLFAVGIVLISFKTTNFVCFLKLLAAFFSASLLFAGVLMALWLLLLPNGALFHNGILYLDISPIILIVSAALCYGILTLFEKLFERKTPKNLTARVTITVNGSSVALNAFCDTGNKLCDSITGLPCMIAELSALSPIFDSKTQKLLQDGDISCIEKLDESWAKRIRVISFDSVGGSGLLTAFRPDEILLNGTPVKMIVAVFAGSLMKNGCQAIIPQLDIPEK